ncbi:MAG: GNAT family N-acetyltransferase [Pseudomonadota bacterium]
MTARHEQATPGPAEDLAAMFNALAPTIQTERLLLRAPVLSDFPACAEIACGERGRFVGGPMSRDAAWAEFTAMVAGWSLHGHGGFAVEDAEGNVLGFVVLGLEPGDHEVELGFSLTEAAEGNGFAEEAARAVRTWAATELELTGLVSYIDPENVRSVALAKRLGATRDTKAEAAIGASTHVYRHPEGQS